MHTAEQLIEDIRNLSERYIPSREIQEHLAARTFVPLVGAFATGKSSLVAAVPEIDSQFCQVRSFTTRDPRPGEAPSAQEFTPPNTKNLQGILAQAQEGSLVNLTIHPTTGNIYGTRVYTYANSFCVLETMPRDVRIIGRFFAETRPIVVATESEEWLQRLDNRAKNTPVDDVRKRLDEGVSNLSWSLDQGDKVAWVDNSCRSIQNAAQEIVAVVKDGQRPDPEARSVGQKLLNTMQDFRASL